MFAASAQAATVDLTTAPSSGTIEGAIFSTADFNTGAGSGNIDSFLRIQAGNSEQGYNTDAPSQDYEFDEVAGCCTHSLQLSELGIFDVGGTDYFQLSLDIAEPGGGPNSFIDLVGMEIYINTTTGSATGYPALGTLVYDMDAGEDSTVLMRAGLLGGPGNGNIDVNVLVPASVLAGFDPSDYLYLYSAFDNSDGSFEEWAADTGAGAVIPVPAAAWLFGSALALFGWMRRAPP